LLMQPIHLSGPRFHLVQQALKQLLVQVLAPCGEPLIQEQIGAS